MDDALLLEADPVPFPARGSVSETAGVPLPVAYSRGGRGAGRGLDPFPRPAARGSVAETAGGPGSVAETETIALEDEALLAPLPPTMVAPA